MKTLLRLLGIVRGYQWWMLFASFLGFATIGSGIGLLISAAYILAKAALHPPFQELQIGIAGVRLFGLARGALRYAERLVSHSTTFRILSRLRVWFYESIEPLAPARLLQYKSGDLLQRISGDIDSLENLYSRVVAPPLTALMITVLLWFLMGIFSPAFSVALLCFHAAAALGLPLLSARFNRGTAEKMAAIRAELQTMTIDSIQGLGDLMLFGRIDDHTEKIRRLKQEELRLQRKQALVQRAHEPLTGLLMNFAVLAIFWLLLPKVSGGMIDGVYTTLIVIAVMASFEAFLPLPDTAQHLEASETAGKRLFEIVDTRPVVTAPESPQPFPENHSIDFRNVSFSYPGSSRPALSNVSFTLREGEKIAIVGPSGAGKSTLSHLLFRFWNPSQGAITIGDTGIDRLDPGTLRANIGIVSQKSYLFGETIRKNLQLAKPDACDDELRKALTSAGLASFTEKLDQWVGQHGMKLSGGERQRLTIARMLLKNAPVIVLDEATANLDNITGQTIMRTFFKLCGQKTATSLLVITHRLQNMSLFDKILVLENGVVTEKGSHHELLKNKGLYASMWSLQNRQTPSKLIQGY